MGNHCSAKLAPKLAYPDTCGVLHGGSARGDDLPSCGICGEEPPASAMAGPHPLLLEEYNYDTSGISSFAPTTPTTPRGPVPPWAVTPDPNKLNVDLTATGPTPPRSPTPTRAAPPGVPEDELGHDPLGPNVLAAQIDEESPSLSEDIFKDARNGNAEGLHAKLKAIDGSALRLVKSAMGAVPEGTDKHEKACEIAAAYLNQLRSPAAGPPGGPCHETLLGATASGGHVEAVQILLYSQADPAICDDHGCTALHRAAESGHRLTVLLVLDRMQASSRAISISELTNIDGETPEMFAALAGASEVCRAFEIFSEMQNEAEERQLGCSNLATDFAGHRNSNAGSILAFVDAAFDPQSSQESKSAASLLHRSVAGNGMVTDIFQRVTQDPRELQHLVDDVCSGIRLAEETLLSPCWNPADQGLEPVVRAFHRTAEVRREWQNIRNETVQSEKQEKAVCLDDFWQTHISAETMVSTLMNARSDTFQFLLTVLWLYTREAWLRHILDTLSSAACGSSMPARNSMADGATGATPLNQETRSPTEDLIKNLSPLMQLVQSALGWFEEQGIRHTAVTYRPLSLPMLGLQRVIDRYIAARHRENTGNSDTSLTSGAWIALGAGTFFSAMSSRSEAIKRMSRARCNVLLVIRPDEQQTCFPKQMSLRGHAVDDVIFPLGAMFRITRITRTVSSDLDPEACRVNLSDSRSVTSSVRWPVMIFELAAANRFLEVLEILEPRGDLAHNELEKRLKAWIDGATKDDAHERLLEAGELLIHCSASSVKGNADDGDFVTDPHSRSSNRYALAAEFLDSAVHKAETAGDTDCMARSLLALARSRIYGGLTEVEQVATDGKKAIRMLTHAHGANHPDTNAARAAWRELGVPVRNP